MLFSAQSTRKGQSGLKTNFNLSHNGMAVVVTAVVVTVVAPAAAPIAAATTAAEAVEGVVRE